jgi:HSP20 family protein
MAISRWSPISDLMSLHSAMDRLFNDSLTGAGRARRVGDTFGVSGEGFLPLDVYQTDKEWIIRAGVPSVDPQQVEITCDGNTIRIQGEVKPPQNLKSENYWMRENFYGAFTREITLPEQTLCDQSKAEFQNGMLVLTLPKAQPSKSQVKKIPVTAGASSASTARARTATPSSATGQSRPTGNGGATTTGDRSKQREPQATARK